MYKDFQTVVKRYGIKVSQLPIRILLRIGFLALIVRLATYRWVSKPLLFSFIELFVSRTDLVHLAQKTPVSKFFCVDTVTVEQILEGDGLSVFDVGAAGNIEAGLERYRHLLEVILAEPRNDESLMANPPILLLYRS